MAVIYCRSTDGNDSDDGSTWALAKATLAAALTAAGAGGTVYVSDNHAETQASAMALTSPGTAASPTVVLCVDDAAEPPTTRATTATVTTTGAFNITINGFSYCYGITFASGTGAGGQQLILGSGTPFYWRFDNCALTMPATGSGSLISVGQSNPSATDDHVVELVNSTIKFANSGQRLAVYANLRWFGGSVDASGTSPAILILLTSVPGCRADLNGVDLSFLGAGQNIVVGTNARPNFINLTNCKLGSGVGMVSGAIPGPGGLELQVVNCDSADTAYRYHRQTWYGTITHETVIVRTGGASDGTTAISRKMVSTADTKWWLPLVSDPIAAWNETVGSTVTVTVEVVTDNVTLTDAECWLEVEYLGTSGVPMSLRSSDRLADPVFGTPANQTTSTETWTTTGLATPVKQKLSVTVTPQEKGLIRARVALAKPSTTVYVDPYILASSGRQYQTECLYVNEEVPGSTPPTEVYKALLVLSSYGFNPDHSFVSDVSAHEATGATRQTLTARSVTQDDASNTAKFTAGVVTFPSVPVGQTLGGMWIYRYVSSDADSVLYSFHPFTAATDGTNVNITPPAAGFLQQY
jgi:hypothetical protein